MSSFVLILHILLERVCVLTGSTFVVVTISTGLETANLEQRPVGLLCDMSNQLYYNHMVMSSSQIYTGE